VFACDQLGMGRLLYGLPIGICKAYIKEVFDTGESARLDPEILNTINIFFDNGLNISETARKLYLHRNTLVYRLEKLQKTIGLDIRNFEDAMTYKIVAMVLDYIKYMESKKS
jgi:carbohydrate diacid regulator